MSSLSRCGLSMSVLSLVVLAGCKSGGHAEKPVAAHSGPHWSYSGETGPSHWGSLSPDCATCSNGQSQSPINLVATSEIDLPNIAFTYSVSPIEVVNNGHTVQVNYAPGSYIQLDGRRYDLVQFHFHSPSEHTIGGKPAAMEMHLVHKAADGKLAVVGVMLVEGAHNPAFDPLWAHLPKAKAPASRPGTSIDAAALLPADQRTFRYDGSLTTPPCSEQVKWSVFVTPVTLSPAQIARYRAIFSGTNRPVQPVNGRSVILDSTR